MRSTSGNNRKLNDEKNKSHIARAKRHTLKDLSYDTNKPDFFSTPTYKPVSYKKQLRILT